MTFIKLAWLNEQELGPWDLVHQQRRHHQSGATRGFRVLLADEGKHLGDMADAPVVERAEDDADDVAEPLAGRDGKRRLTFDVGNAELIEDPDCAVSLILEQRQVGNQRLAFPEACSQSAQAKFQPVTAAIRPSYCRRAPFQPPSAAAPSCRAAAPAEAAHRATIRTGIARQT